tara:strand:- start:9873 stop:10706 length:834 start_codon:yes stop_codon:yes gene_type:complete
MYKYIENRQMVEQAARYSVWERVAYFGSAPGGSVDDAPEKSDETIALEIEGRILSHSKSRITTKSDSGQNSEPLNPVLRVRTGIDGELTPIYEEAEEDNEGQSAMYVSVSTAEHGLAGFGSLQSAFGKVLDLSDGFNPNLKGVYESSVSVSLKYLEWFEDSFAEGFSADEALSMSRTNALMTEGWSVGGPTHAKSTVGGLVPTTLFDEIGAESLFSVFSKLPLVKEVSFLNFGKVEPDAVPCARLGEVYNDTELRTPESCMSRLTPQLESYGHTYQE